ncbi:MAG: NADP-dependent isocitrate dehydrogenase [Actinomycetia bacterium]|nr:NADP-dependent isocitrate dehydrogenase [Actinomycetes bacterium]
MSKIIYTHTDEAPALATYSFLPVIAAFAGAAGVDIETRDISLAGRVLANFADRLPEDQRVPDALAELGELAKTPEANIIKLPNISASVPQLVATIEELRAAGYDLPDYPEDPRSDDERDIRARYDRVKGSAVNPVLREGNSDRRAPKAVKEFARNHPHPMGVWSPDSKTHVSTMSSGDFYSNEKSVTMDADDDLRIEHVATDGTVTVLKDPIPVLAGEVVDGTFMSKAALIKFLAEQVVEAREMGVLFSLHLKATMMKVSDPIIFGHGVKAYFADVFDRFGDAIDEAGGDVNNGFGDVLDAIDSMDAGVKADIEAAIEATYNSGPDLAMVNSDLGITNLHVPSDIIIDASMPAMLRASGQMWNKNNEQQDTKCVIPDHSYAGIYQAVIDDCIANGAYDPTTMGSVPNVGLMAQKAEEYGSHDKTFEVAGPGTVRVVSGSGDVLMEHEVGTGDIWRMCNVKDLPIQDWVKLAVGRARASGVPAVFWLDENRAHDARLIEKINKYLPDHNTDGIEIDIMAPAAASAHSLDRIRQGLDTISVTGNVLRDFNTDLFPILEVGTSAKMLSIVPLMNGGGLFETGAGGSAPKHVQQFEKENHSRWDSLGEFLALAVSFEHLANSFDNEVAGLLGETLDEATARLLEENKSPSRKVDEIDNRGSHFYLAMFWARAMASQTTNEDLAARFTPLADALEAAEETISADLITNQGVPMDIGGYYFPNPELASAAMRPSETFNQILADFAT